MEKLIQKTRERDSLENLALKETRADKKRKYVWDYIILSKEVEYLQKTKK